ncbi:MAG: GNAT family N-acetyltransferase [Gammaproteobacteria bacterium]|nr:GNAT family N-acetyltransferase [Gammaproteobacteria bacterium]
MPISIREAKASQQDREWIEQAYGDYLADLAADQTGVFPSLTVTGQSIAELVQGWFRDERSVPFVILRENQLAGFALVQHETAADDRKRHYRLSEFFVGASFRRCGVGRGAAMLLFSRFAGEWTIAEQARNPGAIRFWRRVVAEYTNGDFRERRAHGEVAHQFSTYRGATAPAR